MRGKPMKQTSFSDLAYEHKKNDLPPLNETSN